MEEGTEEAVVPQPPMSTTVSEEGANKNVLTGESGFSIDVESGVASEGTTQE